MTTTTPLAEDRAPSNGSLAAAPSSARLGEELPIFCERCGYSLNGLPQVRCTHCAVLQFHCPECGHHQPINTLRPAVQKVLGRRRALGLAIIVFVKFNFLLWPLVGWVGMGVETAYERHWQATRTVVVGGQTRQMRVRQFQPIHLNAEILLALGTFAVAFGAVERMLLLRWRRSYLVGAVLGLLATAALALGAHLERVFEQDSGIPSPYSFDFLLLMGLVFSAVLFAAVVVWPIWTLLVNVFLPRTAATALLSWQREGWKPATALARE